jgi:hypothetical protein
MNTKTAEKSKPKNEKLIGCILLTLGIALLLFSIVEMLNVYSGNSSPPKLINLSDITWPGQNGTSTTLIQGNQLSQIPNLFFWFLLMFFVMFAAGKIASIGVNMIKDIKVEVKEPLLTPKETKNNETEEAPNAKT